MSPYKIHETDTHIYFLSGPGSNWHKRPFHGQLAADGPTIMFACGEQYLMAAKSLLFHDNANLKMIMEAKEPSRHKQLGRKVTPFNEAIWRNNARDIMFRGCWYKQAGDESYADFLDNSGDKVLVEGADYDPVWGVGVAWNDARILNESNWKGTNWLGQTHMAVRKYRRMLRERRLSEMSVKFNPWTTSFE